MNFNKKIIICILFLLSFNLVYSINSTVISGINLTYEFNSPSSYSSTPISFSQINSVIPINTNLTSKKINHSILHSTNIYDTQVKIYSEISNPSSLLCSSSLNNLNLEDCIVTYDDSMITDPKTYYGYVCNNQNDCSLSFPFTFILNDNIEYMTSGIIFNLETSRSGTYTSNPISFSTVSSVIPTSTDIASNQVIKEISYSSNHYNTQVQIYSQISNPSSLLCSSTLNNLTLQDCIINYDDSMITNPQTYYAYICNERNDCSLSLPFPFMLNDNIEYLTTGIIFEFQKDFNGTVIPSPLGGSSGSSSSGSSVSILPFGGTPIMAFTSLLLIGLSLFIS